jgi:hypothetical protein
MRTDKQETYSVDAVNADLRHYLKRLARKSRCFTRNMQSLAKNIQLFVYCYNQDNRRNVVSLNTSFISSISYHFLFRYSPISKDVWTVYNQINVYPSHYAQCLFPAKRSCHSCGTGEGFQHALGLVLGERFDIRHLVFRCWDAFHRIVHLEFGVCPGEERT